MSADKRERALFAARIIWRTILAATGVAGLCINFFNTERFGELLSYYTIQSNILCTLFFAAILILELYGKLAIDRRYRIVKCALTMCIMVTFLVYHFILVPQLSAEGAKLTTGYNIMLHYLLPLGVFADWLMFDKKGEISVREPLWWALIPLAYPVYVLIYTSLGGRYAGGASKAPYFFLDTTKYGVGGVLLWILAIAAGFFILSYLFVALDRLLAALGRRLSAKRAGAK